MNDKIIPEDIERFILEKIDSVAEMEALILLRSDAEALWSVVSLAKRLYIAEEQTAKILDHLCAEGLLTTSSDEHPGYRYQPKSLELQNSVDRVAEIYTKHLVPISNLIHSKPRARVQEFADAFRLRKDN
jgi:DNA-binding IclR family transcriptional regulator